MKTLKKKIIIKGKIKLLTGLHIGGSNNTLQIGGIDNSIVRNPLDNKPIIPGSSLKGKMRCLLEQSYGVCGGSVGKKVKNGPTDSSKYEDLNAKPILELFGMASSGDEINNIPSRLIVRDCVLVSDDTLFEKTDLPYTEIKTEIVVDRVTAGAVPRPMERVPAGAEFSLEMIINIFDDEKEEALLNLLASGMKLLHDDYLGGSGSRGSGKVEFVITSIKERDKNYYIENKKEEKDLTQDSMKIFSGIRIEPENN